MVDERRPQWGGVKSEKELTVHMAGGMEGGTDCGNSVGEGLEAGISLSSGNPDDRWGWA